jgi:hypothetical protein
MRRCNLRKLELAQVTLRLTLAPVLMLLQVFRESGSLGPHDFARIVSGFT